MPHDKNGNLIEVGAEVMIRAKVLSVQTAENYCNLTVETIETMPGSTKSTIVLNTRQTELVQHEAAAEIAQAVETPI